MATNGDNQRLATLAENLRGAQVTAGDVRGILKSDSDLGTRMDDVIAQLREIASYTSEYADNLQEGLVQYERSVQQMLGKVGK
jgi:hypothetical protein